MTHTVSKPSTRVDVDGLSLKYRPRRINRQARERLTHYLLLTPALLLSMCIVLVPAIFTFITSFTDWNGIDLAPAFVGLQNFTEIFDDPIFWVSLRNNVIWTVLFLTVPVVLGMGSAVLLLKRKKMRAAYQVIFLLPYVLASIVNALVWLNIIYNPLSGLLGYFNDLGWELQSPLANLDTAIYGVAAVDIWHYWGFLTVVYLAALRQTPVEQVEAALLEGANGFQIFRYVYLPNIKSTVQLMFVLIVIFSFLAFDYVYLMTQGGPAHSTEVLGTYAYSFAFSTFQFGKAAAVALVMGLFGLLASFLYTFVSRKDLSA